MKTLRLLDFVETPAFALVYPDQGDPCIVFWNARAENATGLTRDDVIGQVPTEVMGSLAEPLLSRSWIEKTGEVRVDGLGVVNLVALPDNRTVIGTVLTAAQKAADSEREMFLGMAIHDARAPLRNINYICEELLVDFDEIGDGRNQLVRKIRAIVDRTLVMSDDILSAVHAASMQESHPVVVQLQPLCDMIFATLDPKGEHRLTGSATEIEVERPVLQVVLRNLVDNAIKHGNTHRPLSIDVQVSEDRAGEIAVHVIDDGAGITDDALNALASGNVQRGSGFGLYGIQRLVETRGGQITARRRGLGKAGSEITVTLPGRIVADGMVGLTSRVS
jgi:signal transduction histidine kinase